MRAALGWEALADHGSGPAVLAPAKRRGVGGGGGIRWGSESLRGRGYNS